MNENMNLPMEDLKVNLWPEEDGGPAAQIAFWRAELARGEQFDGEEAEFEKYIADNNLEG